MTILSMDTGTRGYRSIAYFYIYGYYPYPTNLVMGMARV
jgi:hypothetical protein